VEKVDTGDGIGFGIIVLRRDLAGFLEELAVTAVIALVHAISQSFGSKIESLSSFIDGLSC
jgi:hypothetical protein